MNKTELPDDEQLILDRELVELLNELRVVLPGVSVLFAFLLTLPFTARFTEISMHSRDTYFIAFACSAASAILLITPSAYHRLIGGGYDKERLIRTSSKLAIAGIVLLGIALTAVVLLVTTVIYDAALARWAAAAAAILACVLWLGVPLQRRWRRNHE
jgi:hypothetical protein